MTDYTKCAQTDCNPVMQSRTEDPDAHLNEVHPDNATDVRIVCLTCGLATGWNKADAPGMEGIGKVHIAKVWTDMTAKKDVRASMLARLRKEFGDEAVAEHFKHSL